MLSARKYLGAYKLYEARTGKKYLQFIKRNSWIRWKLTRVYRATMESAGNFSWLDVPVCRGPAIFCLLIPESPWASLHRPDSPYLISWIRSSTKICFTIPGTATSLSSFSSAQFCHNSRTWPLLGQYKGVLFFHLFPPDQKHSPVSLSPELTYTS